jgi:hypothetical protein
VVRRRWWRARRRLVRVALLVARLLLRLRLLVLLL